MNLFSVPEVMPYGRAMSPLYRGVILTVILSQIAQLIAILFRVCCSGIAICWHKMQPHVRDQRNLDPTRSDFVRQEIMYVFERLLRLPTFQVLYISRSASAI
jgi:hypothetical protein